MDRALSGEQVSVDAPDMNELSVMQSKMAAILARYETDRNSLERKYPLTLSPVRHARMKRFYTGWRLALEHLVFDALDTEDRIDYLLFQNHLDYSLRQLNLQANRLAEMTPLVPFAEALLRMEEQRQRMEWVDPSQGAALLNEIAQEIEQTRQRVEADLAAVDQPPQTPARLCKPTVANRTAETLDRLRENLKHWFTFYHGYDPLFTWWVEEPYKGVDRALQQYADLLREKVVGVKPGDENIIIGDPIGREALLVELAFEMIPYTPEELIAIANAELAWCEAEMRAAARDLGYGEDWRKALEYVKTRHREPGQQPELIRELALEAIAFLDQHDLVTVPPLARETWRMEMMSPEKQRVNPFFLGGETIQVSFPTHMMPHAQKKMSLRGNNIHFARATVHHELIPGHHLQGYMMQRYRPYRRVLKTPFWTEGWALYWEMLLWDMQFAKSPEDRIGMLFWRMHRAARILFSLGFHLEQMTPSECIALLVDRMGHERANATAEVRRSFQGSYGPLYQCAYLLGGLQIRALRQELVNAGKMTDRAFHDAILQENCIPIEMVRASLTQQTLPRDFVSHWKFYSPLAKQK